MQYNLEVDPALEFSEALLGRHAIGAIIFGHDNLWTVR